MASMLGIETNIPLVVDLDGTLTVTDTLYESFAKLLFRDPLAALASLLQIARGPAAVKRIRRASAAGWTPRPCRTGPSWSISSRAEKARGRPIHLVTAADQSIADLVAGELGLFDSATGSNGAHNLKGPNKLAHLREKFPGRLHLCGRRSRRPSGFPRRARRHPVRRRQRDARPRSRARRAGQSAPSGQRGCAPGCAPFALHQWAKNILLFVPLFVGHAYGDPRTIAAARSASCCCACCRRRPTSSTISPISMPTGSTPTKRLRPFASGDIKILHGLIAAPLMIVGRARRRLCAVAAVRGGAVRLSAC